MEVDRRVGYNLLIVKIYCTLHKTHLHTRLDSRPLECNPAAPYSVATFYRLCCLAPGTLTLPRADQVLTGAYFKIVGPVIRLHFGYLVKGESGYSNCLGFS